jgi:hypothetical protein
LIETATENWYKGEIGFLDFYVIPLAKKLKECGVFGVSSDEYLSYALQNKETWLNKGEEVIAEMRQKINNSRNRKGKSLKTMSLLHGSLEFGKQGNTSFSSFASVTEGGYPGPASPTKSGSRRNLLKTTGSKKSLMASFPNRRNSTGPTETGNSGSLPATSSNHRRNSTGSGQNLQQLEKSPRSRPSLRNINMKRGNSQSKLAVQNALKYSNHSLDSNGDQRNPKETPLRQMLKDGTTMGEDS